jgi:hypothetical protein
VKEKYRAIQSCGTTMKEVVEETIWDREGI